MKLYDLLEAKTKGKTIRAMLSRMSKAEREDLEDHGTKRSIRWREFFVRRGITSLEGSPLKINGSFDCSNNLLTTLKGAPQEIADSFNVSTNNITSLEGGPFIVEGRYALSYNKLTSLEGLNVRQAGEIYLDHNDITSLKDIHRQISETSFITFFDNPIKSNVLGLLKIKGLTGVLLQSDISAVNKPLGAALSKVDIIINRHLKTGDIFACQEELEDAGLEEYAKL